MGKKYIIELIYKLLDKGYSKELIIFYIASTVDVDFDVDVIERLYKKAKTNWLKANYINYDNVKPVPTEKDKELQEKLEEEEKLKLIKFKETNIINGIELQTENYKYIINNRIISKDNLNFKSLSDIRKYEKEKLKQLTEEITELKAIYEQYIRRWKILNNNKQEKNNSFRITDKMYLNIIEGTWYFLILKFLIEKIFKK